MSAIGYLIAAAAGGLLGYNTGYNIANNELQGKIRQLETQIYDLQEQIRLLRAENNELRRQMEKIVLSLQGILAFLMQMRDTQVQPQAQPLPQTYR